MKFNKETARKELVAKMTAKGEKLNLSERSINEMLDNLMSVVANEEMELNDFVEKCLPMFKTADSNVRNDVSQRYKQLEDDFNKNHEKTPPGGNDDEITKRLAEYDKRLAEYEKRIKENDEKTAVESKKSEIKAKLKDKKVNNEKWVDDMLNMISINSDTDTDSKATELVEMYNRHASEVIKTPTPGATGKHTDKDEFSTLVSLRESRNKIEE